MSITRAKRREGSYVVGSVRRGLNANAEHPTSDPANIQDPRRIKSSQRDCERRWAGASIVCTKPKIGLHKIDITQSDPIKGNFSNVARCRLSGTLLGPTNHHNYQPQLRSLYEQRFSRRMSFADYQRQIEIANDPALIERWKEEARTVTTFTTSREETPSIFSSAAEAERHFRSKYLTGLLHSVAEVIIGGVLSRRLHDRALDRAIE